MGVDNSVVSLSHGAPLWIVLALAILLGLRHATDPDHLAAVTTLVASSGRAGLRAASGLGLAWGLGHGLTLFVLGAPAIVFRPYLPRAILHGTEALVGVVIVLLAIRLLRRWRRGRLQGKHAHRVAGRTPFGAFAIGLLHGFGGSAAAAVLVLATIDSRPVAVGALALLAFAAAVSMTALSTGFGLALVRGPERLRLEAAIPVLGVLTLAFGTWYGLAALSLVHLSL